MQALLGTQIKFAVHHARAVNSAWVVFTYETSGNWFPETIGIICIKYNLISTFVLFHQYIRYFFVLVHQHDHHDVM